MIRISSPDPGQATLTLGSGARARAGQEVIALGTPLGLQNTVTRGIVSAVREVGGLTLVQTDAAINPGNSGGRCSIDRGQVIGITTIGVKSSEAQGLGFAVAIEHAQALLAGKRVDRSARHAAVSTLNEAMSGRAAPADATPARERGAKSYADGDRSAGAARRRARRAVAARSSASATRGRIAAVARPRVVRALGSARDAGRRCRPAARRRSTTSSARPTRSATASLAAGEAARQADVYPGTRREMPAALPPRLPGWDR